MFLENKNALLGKTRYTLYSFVAVLTFKVIQGEWFSCYLKANMRLPISDQ